jgi:hypothetical protein
VNGRMPSFVSVARRFAVAVMVVAISAHAHDAGDMLDWTHAPRDTLPWGVLAKVGIRHVDGRVVPQFLPPVLELDGQRVTLYGFMTPVGEEPRSPQFLLSERPLACGSCDPVGPEGIVEVNMKSAVPRATRAIAVRGVLHVLPADPKNVLYRLTDARIVTREPARKSSR